MVYQRVEEVDFTLASLPRLPAPKEVLMITPAHYKIAYVINPHMQGNIGSVDSEKAWRQWRDLKAVYEELGIQTHIMDGVAGYPDMVFCANQTLPFFRPSDGEKGVILSNMHAAERKGEVPFVSTFFSREGYTIQSAPDARDADFEGMGDAIWHANRSLLWGGYGYRTSRRVYESITRVLDVKTITLELTDPSFYHLDTCFSVLTEDAVMFYPEAFTNEGRKFIHHFFDKAIACPETESRELFACNAHCPDQQHVIIQRGCSVTQHMLKEAGFTPIEVDTSEFLKSGASVFCMKQMFW